MPFATAASARRAIGGATALAALAFRNVLRHRSRTAMVLAAIAFGVAALIVTGGFVQDIYLKLAEALIRSQSGHLQIARASYFAEGSRSPEKNLLRDPADISAAVTRSAPGAAAMTRLGFSGLLNNGRTDFPIVGEGVEPAREAAGASHVKMLAGRTLAPDDRFAMVVGQGLAEALRLAPGDRANLVASSIDGAMNTLDFEIVGVSQSFSKDYDARAVKVPLAAAQELLDTTGGNVVVVMLPETRETQRVAAALAADLSKQGLAVRDWEELNDFYRGTVDLYDRQFLVLRLIVLVMVMLAVANAVNMTVFERAGEFGTVRALGRRSRQVFALVITETIILGGLGAFLGVVAGVLVAAVASTIGIPMPPPPNSELGYTAQIAIVPSVVAGAFAVGVVATALAGILPALRVARMPVVEALRQAT
ncbi:MAG: ABC transporter permease [Burkholderiales bacterium]|nr:ABC transporter permease [Burkholderiales bacterium]